MSRPRPRTIAIGAALVLMLAATPFIPRGDDDEGAIRPSQGSKADAYAPALTAGASTVTPAMQAEIDRVVAEGRRVGRIGSKASAVSLADQLVRCADFDGQRYCLGTGWTEDTEAQVRARMTRAARVAERSDPTRINTGDLGPAALLEHAARMSPAVRARAERAELEMAARSVAKVWLLRHDIEGVPLPADFLATHPEARVATSGTAMRTKGTKVPSTSPSTSPTKDPTKDPTKSPTKDPTRSASASPSATDSPTAVVSSNVKTKADYPKKFAILDKTHVAEQTRTYWCGPTSMQMIAWGWKNKHRSQDHWAKLLHTTTSGTAITDMVRVVNRRTGWDRPNHAGPYITLDIGSWSFKKWMLLMMRHIYDYKAPVVLHPILLKRFYPYLDDDASGHYQVGRGYDKNGRKPPTLSYFEPWNQQRFDPSEPYIARVQWRQAYKSYRGNQAHFAHNVGV